MQQFRFAFHPRYRRYLRLLGITQDTTLVTVTDDDPRARFGGWKLETPRANVCDTLITGPYRPIKAIGVRGSLADSGLTFGTTPFDRGLCVLFDERVLAMLLRWSSTPPPPSPWPTWKDSRPRRPRSGEGGEAAPRDAPPPEADGAPQLVRAAAPDASSRS